MKAEKREEVYPQFVRCGEVPPNRIDGRTRPGRAWKTGIPRRGPVNEEKRRNLATKTPRRTVIHMIQ